MSQESLAGGLNPYDLKLPERLLLPDLHRRRGVSTHRVVLDSAGDAEISIRTWSGCVAQCLGSGDHGPGRRVMLTVACESLPHCTSCECGNGHVVVLSPATVAQLLEALA